MNATRRPATLDDAQGLFELRRKSIAVLASRGMPAARAESWAASLTVAGMARKICEMEIWVAESNGTLVGWGAIRGDRLEGLYTDPEFAGRGIGTELLYWLEGVMRTRGVRIVHADASANAEGFYLRRGYQPAGLARAERGLPIMKSLG